MAGPMPISSLLLSELKEDPLYREEGLCVLGIFGKSTLQADAAKERLVASLTERHVFPLLGPEDSPADDGLIQAYYQAENRVLYLMLNSVCDGQQLLLACEALEAGCGHAEAHERWKAAERRLCLRLLYLFSLCHILLLVHPSCGFDVTYDRLFRALDALRQKLLPLLRAAIKDCPVSKEWRLNCRPCPPRLLFVFQLNGVLRVSGPGSAAPADVTGNNPEKPKKHSPRRRLQHALEDQIYRIFRKSRVLTNQSINCLFTVPANQAFVYVLPGPEEDPVSALLGQLRSQCSLRESETLTGPRRYQQLRHLARQPSFSVESSPGSPGSGQLVDCTLREFLWQHIDLVLTKKGFDDSVGRNPQPSHFELPTYSKWAQVAQRLYHVLLDDKDEELAELAHKVQGQLKVLESFLDADAKFSENRCQKALPLAHSAYQSNLPHNYTTTVHKNQLAQALRIYSQHARGVAFQRYAMQLHEDCYKFWSNGHQLCEERSLTDQHCVHKFHLLPKPGEKPEMDHNPPILFHNSRGRSTSACNCGRKQAPREDPFDVKAANYDFYQMLEEKCCWKLEHIHFPIFQSSTLDPEPVHNEVSPTIEPEAEGETEKIKDKEATGHSPGEGTNLSLALSLGQSADSLGPYGGVEGTEGQEKRPGLVDRQPSTVEYLPGMINSGCPKGLLPKFSSWSLVKLGPAKAYNFHTGLDQPGFLPNSAFLLPWDIMIRRSEEDMGQAEQFDSGPCSWPAPNKTLQGKRGGLGLGRGRRRDDVARAFVGFEYEDGRGRRFMSSGPDKVMKVLGPGGPKEPAARVLSSDMPLYIPSPSQGRGLKPHYSQLARLFIVVPDAPLEVVLTPQVQPGPPPCPVFHPEQPEIILPPDGLWVLRFPYAYVTDRGPCYPPKESQPLSSYRVLKGILRANTSSTPPQ